MQEIREVQIDDTDSAATFAKVHRRTLLKWIQEGHLPAKQLPGGQYRIRRDDLITFLSPSNGSLGESRV